MALTNKQLWERYARAQVDYINLYMALFAVFNAWYSERTQSSNDREAIKRLQADSSFWSVYSQGQTRNRLSSMMVNLVEFTQREPISYATPHWRGVVAHKTDWAGLLEYWYRVRCLVAHGAEVRPTDVYLAYETLNIFVGSVIGTQEH